MTHVALARPDAPTRLHKTARALAPGLILTGLIAGLAFLLRTVPGIAGLSPLILAIAIGMALHNTVGTPTWGKAGVTFSLRRILRFAIILLGLQLSIAQVIALGGTGLAIIAASLGATFLFTTWLGRRLGVERKLASLIAAGTSICGASAVIASNTVMRGSDEDIAYAVACVTIFGSLSMLAYPALPALLQLSAHDYGLWAGASIHEIAQVVAAAFQDGQEAGDFGTIAKLTRVMMLAPTILLLGYAETRRRRLVPAGNAEPGSRQAVPMPWFVLGFILMLLVNSLDILPRGDKALLVQATTFLLTMALAAMGLETDIRKLRAKGWKPLLLGAASWLFIALFSLLLIRLAAG